MAWFAESTVEGFVPSINSGVVMTRAILQSMTTQIGQRLTAAQNAAFGVGGHQLHGGHAWDRLTQNTVDIKRRLGASRPAAPLYRTGNMSKKQRVRVRLVAIPGGIRFQIFGQNTAWYSRFHDSGFRHVWSGKMVSPRHPIEWTMQDLEFASDSIRNFMLGGTKVAPRSKMSLRQRLARGAGLNWKGILGHFTRQRPKG